MISACCWTSSTTLLTLISDVLKLGTVVVLVHDENVKLTNANQRVGCLVSGSYRHGVLPLALAVKFPRGHNCSYKSRHNKADQTAYLHLAVPQIIWNPTRQWFPQFALKPNLKTEQMRSRRKRERWGEERDSRVLIIICKRKVSALIIALCVKRKILNMKNTTWNRSFWWTVQRYPDRYSIQIKDNRVEQTFNKRQVNSTAVLYFHILKTRQTRGRTYMFFSGNLSFLEKCSTLLHFIFTF